MAIKEREVIDASPAVEEAERHIREMQRVPVPPREAGGYRADVITGVLAGLAGLVGLAFAVFGPAVFTYPAGQSITAGPTSLWSNGLATAPGVIFVVAMFVASLGIGTGAIMYVRHLVGRAGRLAILWVSTLVLTAGAMLTLPGESTVVVPSQVATHTPDSVGIGVYLVPAVLLAIAAAIISTATRDEPENTAPVS